MTILVSLVLVWNLAEETDMPVSGVVGYVLVSSLMTSPMQCSLSCSCRPADCEGELLVRLQRHQGECHDATSVESTSAMVKLAPKL